MTYSTANASHRACQLVSLGRGLRSMRLLLTLVFILPPSEHRKQVSTLLDIPSEAVSSRQVDSLRELLLEFHDQLALASGSA